MRGLSHCWQSVMGSTGPEVGFSVRREPLRRQDLVAGCASLRLAVLQLVAGLVQVASISRLCGAGHASVMELCTHHCQTSNAESS